MPSPVAHSLIALTIAETFPWKFHEKRWKNILILVFLSNIPDLDFLPGVILGEPNRFHQGASHSLFTCLLVGLLVSSIYSSKRKEKFILCFFVILSHLILDLFVSDTRLPIGIPLFFPFFMDTYSAGLPIFMSIHRSLSASNFFGSMFVYHNYIALLRETIIVGCFGVILVSIKRKLFTNRDD